jgi:hypothetical protein
LAGGGNGECGSRGNTVILLLVSDIQILKESEEYCVNGPYTFWTKLIMYETHALNLLEPIGNFTYHKV